MRDQPAEITALIEAAGHGDRAAFGTLMEAVYPELHAIARRHLRRERTDHTLQCTALISEAYLHLVTRPETRWNSRAHFFAFAAQTMRGILVDHARARRTVKRTGGGVTVALSARPDDQGVDVLDLHEALQELEALDATQGRVVQLRYFGGLSTEEAAGVMGVSASTVKREWILAKTWLRRRLFVPERPL